MRAGTLGFAMLLACPAEAQEVRQSAPPPGAATGAPGGWSITIGAAPAAPEDLVHGARSVVIRSGNSTFNIGELS